MERVPRRQVLAGLMGVVGTALLPVAAHARGKPTKPPRPTPTPTSTPTADPSLYVNDYVDSF